VTEDELEDIQSGSLSLPNGWRLQRTLYPTTA
jgi:nitrogen fixation protein